MQVKVTGLRRLENGLVVPGSFPRPERPAEQSPPQNLKKRSFVSRIYAFTWAQDHCFCNVALPFVSEQLKEDEPRLIRTRTLMSY